MQREKIGSVEKRSMTAILSSVCKKKSVM